LEPRTVQDKARLFVDRRAQGLLLYMVYGMSRPDAPAAVRLRSHLGRYAQAFALSTVATTSLAQTSKYKALTVWIARVVVTRLFRIIRSIENCM
jgi:hypothetical protein